MKRTPLVRVYIACSLDGFIAGPNDDLSWLTPPEDSSEATASPGEPAPLPPDASPAEEGPLHFEPFLARIGALLMGRRTYDVVRGFGGKWPYGDRPVLVATGRSLPDAPPTVRQLGGSIAELVAEARRAAGERDVYIDGGHLIRQALDAGLVDDLVITFAPIVLGSGHPLFAGVEQRHRFNILSHRDFPGGLMQLHLRPQPAPLPLSSGAADWTAKSHT
jgi:dihydrofolate reductase